MAPLKLEDAQSLKSKSRNASVTAAFRSVSVFLPELLLFRLGGRRLRVLLLLRCGRCSDWRRSALRLRTLALRRSLRSRVRLIPVGFWPIVRLGCRRTIRLRLSIWLGRGRTVGLRPIVRLGCRVHDSALAVDLAGPWADGSVPACLVPAGSVVLTAYGSTPADCSAQADRSGRRCSQDARPVHSPVAELRHDSPEGYKASRWFRVYNGVVSECPRLGSGSNCGRAMVQCSPLLRICAGSLLMLRLNGYRRNMSLASH